MAVVLADTWLPIKVIVLPDLVTPDGSVFVNAAPFEEYCQEEIVVFTAVPTTYIVAGVITPALFILNVLDVADKDIVPPPKLNAHEKVLVNDTPSEVIGISNIPFF